MPNRRLFLTSGIGTVLALPTSANDDKPSTWQGEVVRLGTLLEKAGMKMDIDAMPFWLALQTAKGELFPLIKDEGSRRFFKDDQLLNKAVQITGKLHQASKMLQVLSVLRIIDGQTYEMYYWCDICNIKRYEKMICECCNGPMIYKEDRIDS